MRTPLKLCQRKEKPPLVRRQETVLLQLEAEVDEGVVIRTGQAQDRITQENDHTNTTNDGDSGFAATAVLDLLSQRRNDRQTENDTQYQNRQRIRAGISITVELCNGIEPAPLVEAEHRLDVLPSIFEALGAEQYPTDDKDQNGVNVTKYTRDLFEYLLQAQALQDLEEAVVQTPNKEVPSSTMPEACAGKDDDQIDVGANLALTVTAQRDVQIVLEPGGQRHMPSAPEFLNGTRNVGIVKVLKEVKSEHVTHTDSHVGVTAEVEIDLQRVCDRAQPSRSCGHAICRESKDGICQKCNGVRDNDLLGKTDGKASHTAIYRVNRIGTVLNFALNVDVANDRSCDQLREQRDIQTQIENIALRLYVAPVHVDGVRHDLEGKEGNTDGKNDAGECVVGKEVDILEEEQHTKVKDNGDDQHCKSLLTLFKKLQQQAEDIVDADRDDHKANVNALTPRIEEQRCDQKLDIFRHNVLLRDHVVDQEYDRQENKQEQG